MHPSTVSDRKLAANRANAARSTGPRTAAGKAASSQNARKHRFAIDDYIVNCIDGENDLVELRADLVPIYQPVNAQELHAIDRIALAQQALLRVSRLESGLLLSTLNRGAVEASEPVTLTHPPFIDGDNPLLMTRSQKRNFFLAEGWGRTATSSPETWKLFLRYQAQTERNYRRAVEEFERLKALRPQGEDAPKPLELDLMAGFRPLAPNEPDSAGDVPNSGDPNDESACQESTVTEATPAPATEPDPIPCTLEPIPAGDNPPASASGHPTADASQPQAAPDQLAKTIFPNKPTDTTQRQQSAVVSKVQNEPTGGLVPRPGHPSPEAFCQNDPPTDPAMPPNPTPADPPKIPGMNPHPQTSNLCGHPDHPATLPTRGGM